MKKESEQVEVPSIEEQLKRIKESPEFKKSLEEVDARAKQRKLDDDMLAKNFKSDVLEALKRSMR